MHTARQRLQAELERWPIDREQRVYLARGVGAVEEALAGELETLLKDAREDAEDCLAQLVSVFPSREPTRDLRERIRDLSEIFTNEADLERTRVGNILHLAAAYGVTGVTLIGAISKWFLGEDLQTTSALVWTVVLIGAVVVFSKAGSKGDTGSGRARVPKS